MEFENLLEQYLKIGKHTEVISLLHKQIKIYLTQLLQKYDPNFRYSTINKLSEHAAIYFPLDLYRLVQSYKMIIYEDCQPDYEIEMLLEIYNRLELNIQKNSKIS